MDEYPSTHLGWLNFAANFAAKLSASPGSYAIDAAIAATYAVKQTDFATKLAISTDPSTATAAARQATKESLAVLTAATRTMGRYFKGQPHISNELLMELGLKPRTPRQNHGPYQWEPTLAIESVTGNTVRGRFRDSHHPDRRGRAPNQVAIGICYYIGATAPLDPSMYTKYGNASRTVVDIVFPSDIPAGTTVWLTGYWLNARAETSPGAFPVSARLAGGGLMAESLKIAA